MLDGQPASLAPRRVNQASLFAARVDAAIAEGAQLETERQESEQRYLDTFREDAPLADVMARVWADRGLSPADSSDIEDYMLQVGRRTGSKGGGTGSAGGRGSYEMSVNGRAATGFEAIGEVIGLVPEAARDIKQIVAILEEDKRLQILDNVQRALREQLGPVRMPTPGALGVSPVMLADADGGGRVQYDTSELIDHYTDALRKVGLARQGVIELDYRTFEIKTIGNLKLTPAQYLAENEARYQKAFVAAIDLAEKQYDAGKLRYPAHIPWGQVLPFA